MHEYVVIIHGMFHLFIYDGGTMLNIFEVSSEDEFYIILYLTWFKQPSVPNFFVAREYWCNEAGLASL